ncbi:MAG: crotonase/enoyl-CoA hydratase family protein [Novosphingobium sp.]
MGDEEVITEVDDGILVVTFSRPQAKNAMNRSAAHKIAAAMERLDADPALRVAILTGGGGTFCSGMDLKGFLAGELPVVEGRGFGGIVTRGPDKPLIAAIDGFALAGGLELAMACDLIVASSGATFGLPEVKRGLAAGGGGLVRLPRQIPRRVAMEMALTGEPITAARAYELGLINALCDGPAVEGARALARRIVENAPLAIAASKAVIRDSVFWPEAEMNDRQTPYIAPVFGSKDAQEGPRAFAEKRKPNWTGS